VLVCGGLNTSQCLLVSMLGKDRGSHRQQGGRRQCRSRHDACATPVTKGGRLPGAGMRLAG
jgi:hypothetical protein